jgi:glycosyltransferase involved in cell wall biosynthesis
VDVALPKGSVLLVSEPINPGGIAIYARSIMEGLSAAGISHPLITSTTPGTHLMPPQELVHVKTFGGLFWSAWRPFIFRKLVKWAREQEPILIHGMSALTSPVCQHLAQALEIPFIVTVHHFQKRGVLRAEKRCHSFVAVSEVLRENLVNDAKIPKELVRLIPAGIRAPVDLGPRPAAWMQGKEAFVPLVSSFGKLIQRKDFMTFLDAARMILDRLGRECSFVISGEGPEESLLRKRAKDLKIDKYLTFCHGSAAHEKLLHDTDVYVQCSRAEGFGTMVLQAMAHGVPVVATSTGGILSLVREGETGFLVPVGDAEAVATRVVSLLTDHDLSHRIGEAAREIALGHYSLDNMMKMTLDLYAEAVKVAPVRATA